MILLDTNVVVAFLNGDKSVLKRMRAEIDEVGLSTLVVAELDYGAKVSQRSEENLEKLYRLVDIVQLIPFDVECAKIFGTIKSKLRSIGKPTGEVDALVAATAMAHEATLITANKKHFENIAGLKIEVWPIGSEV
jgi:tRNA(fMet)-specific endonuclease VapC